MCILLRIFENIFKFAQLSLQHYGTFTYCLTTKNRLCKLQTYYIKYIYIYIPRLAAARKSLAGLQVYRPIGCILPWPFYAIILSAGIEQQHLILKRQYNKMKIMQISTAEVVMKSGIKQQHFILKRQYNKMKVMQLSTAQTVMKSGIKQQHLILKGQ